MQLSTLAQATESGQIWLGPAASLGRQLPTDQDVWQEPGDCYALKVVLPHICLKAVQGKRKLAKPPHLQPPVLRHAAETRQHWCQAQKTSDPMMPADGPSETY